ncbi:GGDEF domain-containing protein [Paenibacillus soyae]|uniref:Diguanylate cyclase n=1 Tax=Paenibacillus soyae TaxID=2969249 RepID=A0A9X2SCK5_9BACL|nr:diguanylate cyclase [Paenibacillus soyae]MCR2806167.1 diguanylate cyclase [Paenibacillus soyae]
MKAQLANNQSWNRWILTAFWLLISMILLFSQVVYLLRQSGDGLFGSSFELSPSVMPVAIPSLLTLIVAECLIRMMRRYFEHLLIVIGFAFALLIMLTYSEQETGMYITLGIPIIISYCYFDRGLLQFTTFFTSGAFFVAVQCFPSLKQQIHFVDIIIIFAFTIGMTMIGYAVISRGEELQRSLERAILSELEAFADSVAVENDAKIDHLTGLYNHITYQEYASLLTEQHEWYGMKLLLAVIDIDNFKYVNDTYGHHVGDIVLMKTAALLKHSISHEDIAARYGGEEFVVLLTGKSLEEAVALLDLVRMRLEEASFPELGEHHVTMSVGLAEYRSGMDKDKLFKQADAYLYEAKRSGKNRIVSRHGEEAASYA